MTTLDALVDARFDESVAFLRELVRMPSDTPPGDNAAHAEGTAKLLEALGYTVERHAVPADLAAQRGMRSVTNLVVRHRFGPGPVIALNAHGDVVPPGDGWTKGPYEGVVDKGRMYGRGVAVSKSDFATYTFALDALKRAGHKVGTVELHFTYDEEMGGELGPARFNASSANVYVAKSDFDTATPRPYMRPLSTTPPYGPWVHPSPGGTTSPWAFNAMTGPGPKRWRTTRFVTDLMPRWATRSAGTAWRSTV